MSPAHCRVWRSHASTLLLLVTLVGCADQPPTATPSVRPDVTPGAIAGKGRPDEQPFAELAAMVPGTAGSTSTAVDSLSS